MIHGSKMQHSSLLGPESCNLNNGGRGRLAGGSFGRSDNGTISLLVVARRSRASIPGSIWQLIWQARCYSVVAADHLRAYTKEIDHAHAKKKMWLDTSVPSVRNLKNIAPKEVVIWWLLGLSSVPLHFMYNSVFFSTIATNEYRIVFANEAFIQGGPVD